MMLLFFRITIAPNPQGMSDQEALNAAVVDTSSDPTWHQISNKTIIMDNSTAFLNTFTVDDPTDFTENMILEQINVVKKGNTYTFMFLAPVNEFSNNQANFNTIINSFKIQ